MKGKKELIYILLVICLSCVVGAFSVITILGNTNTSQDIYNKTYNSVVELMAYSLEDEPAFGSAVCVSKEGYFVTNAHNLTYTEGGKTITYKSVKIRFPDAKDYESAVVVDYDTKRDLAIIKYEGSHPLNSLKIEKDYNTGESCYAVGNAQNYGISITEGIIAKKQTIVKNGSKAISAIQCDLSITDGNSGGALINNKGNLIGITTFRTKDNYNNVVYGISFALPAEDIIDYISKSIINAF